MKERRCETCRWCVTCRYWRRSFWWRFRFWSPWRYFGRCENERSPHYRRWTNAPLRCGEWAAKEESDG